MVPAIGEGEGTELEHVFAGVVLPAGSGSFHPQADQAHPAPASSARALPREGVARQAAPLVLAADPADLGAKARRMVHSHVVSEELL